MSEPKIELSFTPVRFEPAVDDSPDQPKSNLNEAEINKANVVASPVIDQNGAAALAQAQQGVPSIEPEQKYAAARHSLSVVGPPPAPAAASGAAANPAEAENKDLAAGIDNARVQQQLDDDKPIFRSPDAEKRFYDVLTERVNNAVADGIKRGLAEARAEKFANQPDNANQPANAENKTFLNDVQKKSMDDLRQTKQKDIDDFAADKKSRARKELIGNCIVLAAVIAFYVLSFVLFLQAGSLQLNGFGSISMMGMPAMLIVGAAYLGFYIGKPKYSEEDEKEARTAIKNCGEIMAHRRGGEFLDKVTEMTKTYYKRPEQKKRAGSDIPGIGKLVKLTEYIKSSESEKEYRERCEEARLAWECVGTAPNSDERINLKTHQATMGDRANKDSAKEATQQQRDLRHRMLGDEHLFKDWQNNPSAIENWFLNRTHYVKIQNDRQMDALADARAKKNPDGAELDEEDVDEAEKKEEAENVDLDRPFDEADAKADAEEDLPPDWPPPPPAAGPNPPPS